MKTYFRRLEQAVQAGDADAIETEHRALVSTIDKAAEHAHRQVVARRQLRQDAA